MVVRAEQLSIETLVDCRGPMLGCPIFGKSGGEIMHVTIIRGADGKPIEVETLEESEKEPGKLKPSFYSPEDFVEMVNSQPIRGN